MGSRAASLPLYLKEEGLRLQSQHPFSALGLQRLNLPGPISSLVNYVGGLHLLKLPTLAAHLR